MTRWIETEARVIESQVRDLDVLGEPSADKSKSVYSDALVRVSWTDEQGVAHNGQFIAPEESQYFQLLEGDTVLINYNFSMPGEFSVRGLARDQAASAAKKIVFAIVVGAAVILVWFGPDVLIFFSK